LLEQPARFDVVAITWANERQPPKIEHYKYAFEPPANWQSMF
jgi:hypothetical protein